MRYIIRHQVVTLFIAAMMTALNGCSLFEIGAYAPDRVQQNSSTEAKISPPAAVNNASAVEVEQINRQFVMNSEQVQSLNIKVGENINFKNSDDTAHNIFSSSEIKTFDLGSFMPGEVRTVSFDKPGSALVECAIHPLMQLNVTVTE